MKVHLNYNSNLWTQPSKGRKLKSDVDLFDDACEINESVSRQISHLPSDTKNDYKVKLSLRDWNTLLAESENNSNRVKYSIEKAEYEGIAKEYSVEMDCTFTIITFEEDQYIQILPKSVAIVEYSVDYQSIKDDGDDGDNSMEYDEQNIEEPGCIGFYSEAHSLFAQSVGLYRVKVKILANYLSPKMNGFDLATPNSTFNYITFTVLKRAQITVTPTSDANYFGKLEKDLDGKIVTRIGASFNPTQFLKVQWTDFDMDEEYGSSSSPNPVVPSNKLDQLDVSSAASVTPAGSSATAKSTKLTVQQYSLCSVGEGVIMVTNLFTFDVQSGSVSTFEIILGHGLKVLSVDGTGIKKWESFPYNSDSNNNSKGESLVKVQLNFSVENQYVLRVTSEIQMESTSGDVLIPSVRCRGNEISREKGYLVVESTANVEVEHQSRGGLTLIDKTEIPNEIVHISSGALLLSYKFLAPNYHLNFRVSKHLDLPVLVAFCEIANFIATCSSEGALLYKLVFRIRNTQQQFIRISIPHPFEIWSTVVGNSAVKPARDDRGTLMIPLQKSNSGERGVQKSFTVELVYKHTQGIPLHENGGDIKLVFPQIDIPIGVLIGSLYLPKEFTYGKFTGNAKEVSYHTRVFPEDAAPIKNIIQSNVIMPQSQMYSNANFEKEEESGGTAGLKPILISIPTFGTHISFQQLLVINSEIELTRSIPLESIVDIEGIVSLSQKPITFATIANIEIMVSSITLVSRSDPHPILFSDLSVNVEIINNHREKINDIQMEIENLDSPDYIDNDCEEQDLYREEEKKRDRKLHLLEKKETEMRTIIELGGDLILTQDRRLDCRVLDLRVPGIQSIFRIKSGLTQLYRDFLLSKQFIEIHTPRLTNHGGYPPPWNQFKLDHQYFQSNDPTFGLVHSNFFYNQLAIAADFDRVFQVGPVFRKDLAYTHRHLTEFIMMDFEMTIKESYLELINMVDELMHTIFSGLQSKYSNEIISVSKLHHAVPITSVSEFSTFFNFKFPSPRFSLQQTLDLMKEYCPNEEIIYNDYNTLQLKLLASIVKEKFDADFFIIEKFPLYFFPFCMPSIPNQQQQQQLQSQQIECTNSFILVLNGEEIGSGSQKIHDPAMLKENLQKNEIKFETINFDSFKYGCPPHGGVQIGLENLLRKYFISGVCFVGSLGLTPDSRSFRFTTDGTDQAFFSEYYDTQCNKQSNYTVFYFGAPVLGTNFDVYYNNVPLAIPKQSYSWVQRLGNSNTNNCYQVCNSIASCGEKYTRGDTAMCVKTYRDGVSRVSASLKTAKFQSLGPNLESLGVQIQYNSLQRCENGLEGTTTVKFHCNSTMTGPEVTYAYKISSCSYLIYIISKHACPVHSTPTPSQTPYPTPSYTPYPTPSHTPYPTPSHTPYPTPSHTPYPSPSQDNNTPDNHSIHNALDNCIRSGFINGFELLSDLLSSEDGVTITKEVVIANALDEAIEKVRKGYNFEIVDFFKSVQFDGIFSKWPNRTERMFIQLEYDLFPLKYESQFNHSIIGEKKSNCTWTIEKSTINTIYYQIGSLYDSGIGDIELFEEVFSIKKPRRSVEIWDLSGILEFYASSNDPEHQEFLNQIFTKYYTKFLLVYIPVNTFPPIKYGYINLLKKFKDFMTQKLNSSTNEDEKSKIKSCLLKLAKNKIDCKRLDLLF
eukprot:gene7738-9518_t